MFPLRDCHDFMEEGAIKDVKKVGALLLVRIYFDFLRRHACLFQLETYRHSFANNPSKSLSRQFRRFGHRSFAAILIKSTRRFPTHRFAARILPQISQNTASLLASLLASGEVMISRSKIPINILMTLAHHSSQTRTIIAKLSQTRARLPREGGKRE